MQLQRLLDRGTRGHPRVRRQVRVLEDHRAGPGASEPFRVASDRPDVAARQLELSELSNNDVYLTGIEVLLDAAEAASDRVRQ